MGKDNLAMENGSAVTGPATQTVKHGGNDAIHDGIVTEKEGNAFMRSMSETQGPGYQKK